MGFFEEWLLSESFDDIYRKITTIGIPVRRGAKSKLNQEYATDVGDFGRGIYYSTNYIVAKQYGPVEKSSIKFTNPLVISDEEAYEIATQYQTVRLSDKRELELFQQFGNRNKEIAKKEMLKNALHLTLDILENGHDGLVVVKNGRLEIVDYRPWRGHGLT